ncbi:MAG: ABC transporter substrate-binding protein [Armatimonadota bacterium]|nr:ABC transporter substrate-binding protein [Armatimonadota bacterium]MDR7408033.1 ABC transporter substrate-binding protein [Armatimonadota bacterium]
MRVISWGAVAVAILLVLSVPGMAQRVPGVTPDTVTIGMPVALSGPVSTIGIPLSRGAEAYFKWVNDQGGIHGRRIRLLLEDDRYIPSETLAVTRKLVERDEVFAIFRPLGTPTGAAILDYLVERNIPVVAPASGSSLWIHPFKRNYFQIQPVYFFEGRIMGKWALEVLKAHRIAVFYQNDSYGKEGRDGFLQYLRLNGVRAVAEVPYEPGETSFTAHAVRLREANPDLVFVYAIPVPAASLLREAARVGLRTRYLMTYVLSDPVMFRLAGELMEGVQAGAWLVDPEDPGPAASAYRARLKAAFPAEVPGGYSISSDASAALFVEGLRRAGRELTRERFIEATETIRSFTAGGLTPPFSYSRNDHSGIRALAMVEARKGKWVTLRPFFSE